MGLQFQLANLAFDQLVYKFSFFEHLKHQTKFRYLKHMKLLILLEQYFLSQLCMSLHLMYLLPKPVANIFN